MKESHLLKQVVRSLLAGQLKAAADPHRPRWHLAAPVGLLNDPNGFIEHDGRYHLFYQWNPLGCAHANKGWGHVTSTDLLHWQHELPALLPIEPYEQSGCYSGSAVSDEQGRLTLIYTGNVKYPDGSRTAYQCLARADGEGGFEKLGPVLDQPAGYSGHVRDPKVWHDGRQWLMVLGARTLDDKGEVLLYRGDALDGWMLVGPIAGSGRGRLGEFGYMWECPDLFPLADRHVLISCPQGIAPRGGGLSQPLPVRLAGGPLRRHSVRARGLPRAGPRLRVLRTPDHPGQPGAPPLVRLAGIAGGERDEPAYPRARLDPPDELPAGVVLAGRLALPAAGGGDFSP